MKIYLFTFLSISQLFSQIDYLSQIQPIFDTHCVSCHSNGGAYFGGLDLSSYAETMEGGDSENTIVPYDHLSSELYNRITLPEDDYQFMPQYGSSLPQSDIDIIAQWIQEGALEQNSNSYPIIGRWILGMYPNTMYEFTENMRLTYYCTEDSCDAEYWDSLDTTDAIPTQNPYTFINDTLTIDLFFGNMFTEAIHFVCSGDVIDFDSQQSDWFRLGTDLEECEDYDGQELNNTSENNIISQFKLEQNYPNPFNPSTTVKYYIPEDGFVKISVYDLLGNIVKELVNSRKPAGYNSVQWNATNYLEKRVAAGVYLYSVELEDLRRIKKMILLK